VVALRGDPARRLRGGEPRAPRDNQLIKDLQQQVKADASFAPKLAAEQKRVTAARRARKSRDNAVAWGLIAAASAFLAFAKKLVRQRPMARANSGRSNGSIGATRGSRADGGARPTLDLSFVDRAVSELGRGRESPFRCCKRFRLTTDTCRTRLCAASAS
jgi:hypothetical protein